MTDNNINLSSWQHPTQELSSVIVNLLKGIIYRDDDQELWRYLLRDQAMVADYTTVIGLDLIIDEAEGFAYLRSREEDDDNHPIPRLVTRRQLSYRVSLLLALLRKKLVEFDAEGSEIRLILSRDQITELLRIFLPAGSNEVKLINQIDTLINKVVDLGFMRKLRGQQNMYEVRRILKAYIDAQWLADFDERLAEYQQLWIDNAEEEPND
ncbi:MAG: DUF4194 domain-containing protein [Eubacteriales bacterium]|nr:DUF4194 domain-containing protein [Eubacteriales bacterium]